MEVARLRLACAVPGEQPSQFSEALRRLGTHRALVVHGDDGLDEISASGSTPRRLRPIALDQPWIMSMSVAQHPVRRRFKA